MSWLVNALKQASQNYLQSNLFEVGGEHFRLCYHPRGGIVGLDETDQNDCNGSLVLKSQTDNGLTFRHSFFIKRAGEFVQWGGTADECFPFENTMDRVYGPDVELDVAPSLDAACPSAGVFGMQHDDLVSSIWCMDDTLVV